jgi:hypothetical protein
VAVFKLGDRKVPRIMVLGYVAISPGEQPNVNVATRDVVEAVGERPPILSDVIFHGDDVVADAAQLAINALPMSF